MTNRGRGSVEAVIVQRQREAGLAERSRSRLQTVYAQITRCDLHSSTWLVCNATLTSLAYPSPEQHTPHIISAHSKRVHVHTVTAVVLLCVHASVACTCTIAAWQPASPLSDSESPKTIIFCRALAAVSRPAMHRDTSSRARITVAAPIACGCNISESDTAVHIRRSKSRTSVATQAQLRRERNRSWR